MNGRIYDPQIGRFLSADPFIQAPYNSQSYNRYSYVWNNPLSMVDPSGFLNDDPPSGQACEINMECHSEPPEEEIEVIVDEEGRIWIDVTGMTESEVQNAIEQASRQMNIDLASNGNRMVISNQEMELSSEGSQFIRSHEGFSPVAYADPLGSGKSSIGYGHQILPGEEFSDGVTKTQAIEVFNDDVEKFVQAVNQLTTTPLSQNQFDALVSFTYNVGIGAYNNSDLLEKLNNGNYSSVPDEMRRWIYSGGNVNSGLIIRRQDEINVFVNGVY